MSFNRARATLLHRCSDLFRCLLNDCFSPRSFAFPLGFFSASGLTFFFSLGGLPLPLPPLPLPLPLPASPLQSSSSPISCFNASCDVSGTRSLAVGRTTELSSAPPTSCRVSARTSCCTCDPLTSGTAGSPSTTFTAVMPSERTRDLLTDTLSLVRSLLFPFFRHLFSLIEQSCFARRSATSLRMIKFLMK